MLKPLVKELMVSLNFFSIGDVKDNRLDGYMVKKIRQDGSFVCSENESNIQKCLIEVIINW